MTRLSLATDTSRLAAARQAPPSRLASALTLTAMSLGFGVVQLDVTIVNTALASIRSALGGGVAELQWVVNAYTIAFAAFILTAGALGDRLGARRIFMGGFALFTLASIGCGLAPDAISLIALRGIQGLGAAVLVPNSLALLNHTYADAKQRGRAVGVWAAGASLALTAGPFVGGTLIALVGWRAIFFVNVPIGLAGLWLAKIYAQETPLHADRSVDLAGAGCGDHFARGARSGRDRSRRTGLDRSRRPAGFRHRDRRRRRLRLAGGTHPAADAALDLVSQPPVCAVRAGGPVGQRLDLRPDLRVQPVFPGDQSPVGVRDRACLRAHARCRVPGQSGRAAPGRADRAARHHRARCNAVGAVLPGAAADCTGNALLGGRSAADRCEQRARSARAAVDLDPAWQCREVPVRRGSRRVECDAADRQRDRSGLVRR